MRYVTPDISIMHVTTHNVDRDKVARIGRCKCNRETEGSKPTFVSPRDLSIGLM